jgi:hypothetical protein
MKTLTLMTFIFCISFGCSPKLFKTPPVGELKDINLSLEQWSDLDIYVLNFKDAHYVNIRDSSPDEESIQDMGISLGSKESVSDLKKDLLKFMDDDSSETMTFRLGADQMIIFNKVITGDIVIIYGRIWNNGWVSITGLLTKERLEKLFPSELFN